MSWPDLFLLALFCSTVVALLLERFMPTGSQSPAD